MLDLFGTHVLLGKVKGSGAPVWYLITELTKHVLIVGRSGVGKTMLLLWIVSELLDHCGVWIFDVAKQEFRHLLRIFPNKLLVVDVMENFRCNPLQPPPGVLPKQWLGLFSDLFCRVDALLGGSKNMLLKTLDKLYERYGVYCGSKDYPSFFELIAALEKLRLAPYSRSARFRESLCGRLEGYLAISSKLYDCSVGYDIESLLTKSVVFELTSVIQEQCDFWINFFLHWIFSYRIAKKERGKGLLNLTVFDEAKKVFSPFENPTLGFAPITHMVSMLREFGVGIVAADQSAQLNHAIWANSQLKILFPLGSGKDLSEAARSMGLSEEQAAYTHSLGLGEAIVRHQRIGKTFVLQVPKFPLE